jgi:hypothetical protein
MRYPQILIPCLWNQFYVHSGTLVLKCNPYTFFKVRSNQQAKIIVGIVCRNVKDRKHRHVHLRPKVVICRKNHRNNPFELFYLGRPLGHSSLCIFQCHAIRRIRGKQYARQQTNITKFASTYLHRMSDHKFHKPFVQFLKQSGFLTKPDSSFKSSWWFCEWFLVHKIS